jgi:hypothetical protein
MTPQQRYVAAMHAMQSGVKTDMETDPNPQSQGATTPKHLRVGLNGALADQGALVRLLVAEYVVAVADAAEAEAAPLRADPERPLRRPEDHARMSAEIDTGNDQLVGRSGDGTISVMVPSRLMTRQQALRHAAWLVAIADDDDEFPAILDAVRST